VLRRIKAKLLVDVMSVNPPIFPDFSLWGKALRRNSKWKA
jgi:hypothetical protein